MDPDRGAQASWHSELGEFVLPYEAVRRAGDPEATLLAFLRSTYDAAARTGAWDRSLEYRAPDAVRRRA